MQAAVTRESRRTRRGGGYIEAIRSFRACTFELVRLRTAYIAVAINVGFVANGGSHKHEALLERMQWKVSGRRAPSPRQWRKLERGFGGRLDPQGPDEARKNRPPASERQHKRAAPVTIQIRDQAIAPVYPDRVLLRPPPAKAVPDVLTRISLGERLTDTALNSSVTAPSWFPSKGRPERPQELPPPDYPIVWQTRS